MKKYALFFVLWVAFYRSASAPPLPIIPSLSTPMMISLKKLLFYQQDRHSIV